MPTALGVAQGYVALSSIPFTATRLNTMSVFSVWVVTDKTSGYDLAHLIALGVVPRYLLRGLNLAFFSNASFGNYPHSP